MKKLIEREDDREMRKVGGIVPLTTAALCVNREHISEAKGEHRPRCGSAPLLSLARILDGEAAA